MPDYNADREAHRDHKWIVHKAVRGTQKGVRVGEKDLMFDREGRFATSDEGLASTIRKEYPREVTVSRVTASHASDRGHKYFFACPKMPWHDLEEEEDAITK
jgi:hypothetical protein